MTLESLIALGLSEDAAKKVLEAHKKAIDGNYVPKETFEAERTKVKDAQTTIAERDRQITELGKFKGTAEELQTKVTELEAKNKADSEKYAADLAKTQQEMTLKMELNGKVIDVDDVIPKLDVTKITFKDGKITDGLQSQLDELKKAKPHYFPKEDGNGGGLPQGWLFGKTPDQGSDSGTVTGKPNTAQEFGKSLAQLKTATSVDTSKVYFQ